MLNVKKRGKMLGIKEEIIVELKHMNTPKNATGLFDSLLISGLDTKLPNVCKPMATEPTHDVIDALLLNSACKATKMSP